MRASTRKVQPEERLQVQPGAQASDAGSRVLEAELQKMIAEAAYYRAEKRGFAPGYERDDWMAAEAEVTARMRAPESRI